MGLLIRTTQTAQFVSVRDPDAVLPDPQPEVWPGPDPDWLPAAGQPESADRVEIRPLSPSQWDECAGLGDDAAEARRSRIVAYGLVSINGNPVSSAADLAFGWDILIANLIMAVSVVPMGGRRSRSAGGQLQG